MHDLAGQVLAQGVPAGVSLRALADRNHCPRTTLQHRARGRRSLKAKAESQQYLSPHEEKALVKMIIQQDALGRSIRIKHIREIAFRLALQRAANRPSKPPGKNWPRFFYNRHKDAIVSTKSSTLDWNRRNIYDKTVHWFDIIGQVLHDRSIPPENFYNMDETGVMLSKPNGVKVLAGKDNASYRGARIKRTTVTAIECVSADGRVLDPMVIWPASTHRANWTTHPTPGWHYAFSDSGYTDSFLSLQWLQRVFDPQTKELAQDKPRVLICDGFGTHETLETLEFCFDNNILLCRLPSHSSHKLQPCDLSAFSPLKEAYRDQVDRLERAYVGTIGKEHFTYLYSYARSKAFTARNIRSGWAKAGLFPFDPEKVLSGIPQPQNDAGTDSCPRDQPSQMPLTPATPASASGVTALQDLLTEETCMLDDTVKCRLRRHIQKLANATQLSFAERALLSEQVQFLAKMNNEAKARRGAKAEVIGTARVMSYEDLEKARAERAEKTAAKAAKKAAKEAKITPKEKGKGKGRQKATEEVTGEQDAETSADAMTHVVEGPSRSSTKRGCNQKKHQSQQMGHLELLQESEVMLEQGKAPVARMW